MFMIAHIPYMTVYITLDVVHHPLEAYHSGDKIIYPKTTTRFITWVRGIPHPLRCHASQCDTPKISPE